LAGSQRYELRFPQSTFKEFLVRDRRGDVAGVLDTARRQGILAGVPVGRWYPELADCFLVAVTEQRTREEIDRWFEVLESA
jgi:glycine dehydrogenase subunit 1